jgi:hypothetical protein
VVQVLGGTGLILRWSESGKLFEIVNEMSLVVVPATQRHFNPINVRSAMDGFECSLKPADPTKGFRRQAYLLGKEFNESALTETHLSQHRTDAHSVRTAAEFPTRKSNRAVQFQRLHHLQ